MSKTMKLLKAVFSAMFLAVVLCSCTVLNAVIEENLTEDWYTDYGQPDQYENTITVMNVGQAQCTLIQSQGKYCLIDAGFADGATDITTYLNQRDVQDIELLVLTHFHSDHTSQVLELMRNFNIKALLIPDLSQENTPTTSFYGVLLQRAEKGVFRLNLARQDREYEIGGGILKVLSDTYNSGSINDTSVCLSFTQNDFVFVYTGDAEVEVEEQIIDKLPENINLYNAAHHGSSDSNSYELLQKLNPDFVTISCGENNDYGHPHRETIYNLQNLNLDYLITYEWGNIVYSMDENRLLEIH